MNQIVSFEIAKLLYKKQCLFESFINYDKNGKLIHINAPLSYPAQSLYPAPVISHVIMYLYKKHNIWISVDFDTENKTWFYNITNLLDTGGNIKDKFNDPIMAYEDAIEYVLNNLI